MAVSELTFALCFLAPIVQDPNLVTALSLSLACYSLSFINLLKWNGLQTMSRAYETHLGIPGKAPVLVHL